MNIGAAAQASGVSAKMIRYYERIGLIAPAGRSEAGYRRYREADVHTLRFIRRARDFGFPIEDIMRLLALWHDRARSSADVREVAQHHAAELRQKIAAMTDMLRALEHLVAHCHGDGRPDCPILDELTGAHEAPVQRKTGDDGDRPGRRTPGTAMSAPGGTGRAISRPARALPQTSTDA